MRPRDILVNITERYITLKVSSITQPLYFAYTLHRSEMQRGCSRDMMSGASAGKILMLTVTWQLGVEIIWKCLHSYIWMLMLVVIKKDKKDPGWSTIWRTYRRMAEYAKREPWVSIMAGGGGADRMHDQIQTQNGLDVPHPHAKTPQMNFLLPLSGTPIFSLVHLVVASKSRRSIPECSGRHLQVCH